MLNKEHKEFLKTEFGRKWLIEKSLEVTPKNENWQENHTPYDFCEKMISKTYLTNKTILVLFNIEFVEVLVHKFGVLSKDITFLADCRLEAELASQSYKVNFVIINKDSIWEVLKGMKNFDLCFSNPPYGHGQQEHLQILLLALPICDEIVYVHPATWLLINKPLSKSYAPHKVIKNTKNKLADRLAEVEIINPKIFKPTKDDYQMIPCSISYIIKNNNNNINVSYFGQINYNLSNINDITIFSDSWLSMVKPFKQIIQKFILKHDNIFNWKRRVKKLSEMSNIENDKYFCKFTTMQPGTEDKSGRFMVEKDYYKVLNPGQSYICNHEDITDVSNTMVYYFDEPIERDNFLNYLKTDFARICLSIYKIDQTLNNGHMTLIPVMDFTQEWTDEKLYQFFNIPQETINYITNFFPDDLYGLRNKP